MIHWLMQRMFGLYIKVLLALKSAVLFDKINQLEWYRETLHQWINGHKFNSNIKILEVGCATGLLSGYLAKRGYATAAVDFSETMIVAASSSILSVDFYVADVINLPFKDGEFDAIVSASVVNIISDQQAAIKEMMRVCKRGGVISILVPAHGFNNEELQDLIKSIGVSDFSEAALRAWHKSAPKMHIHAAEALLHKAGLITAPPISYLQGMVSSVSATNP